MLRWPPTPVGARGSRPHRPIPLVEEIVRPGGFALLATRRLLADRTVAVLAGLLLAAAVALPATGTLYAERATLAGLRSSFVAAAPADTSVRVAIDAPVEEVARVDSAVSSEIGAAIAPTTVPVPDASGPPAGVERVIRSNGLVLDGAPAGDLAVVSSFDHVADHASLAEGAWARPGKAPVEATLSVGAATALGLRVGDVVTLHDPRDTRQSVTLRLVGTWLPDATDPFWEADPLDLAGSQTVRLTTRGPFVVARDDLTAALPGAGVHAEWRGFPDAAVLTPEVSDALRANLVLLPGRVRSVVDADRAVTVTTGLPALLLRLSQAGLVARQTILLLVTELVVLAVYALVLVGGVVAARRRREDALLRERGGTSAGLAGTMLLEGLILGVPALVAAIAIAGAGAGWLVGATVGAAPGMPSGVDGTTVAIAILAAVAGAAALTAPSVRPASSLVSLRTALGRRVGRTFGSRLGLDIALLVLGIIAIWQLRSYGTSIVSGGPAATGSAGGSPGDAGRSVDLVLVLAPALGLVAGAAVVIRLVPRIAEVAERGLGGLRGLVLSLGGREVARRPQRSTRIALLVVFAAALGTLAATHAATWAQSQRDQAAYTVPSDVRVGAGPAAALPGWLAGPAYRAVPGVSAATPVLVRGVDSGPAAGAQLLAVDAVTADALAGRAGTPASLAALRPDLAQLSSAMPADGGIAIPDGTRSVSVTIDAALEARSPDAAAGTPGPALPGVDVRLVVRDADGRISRIEAGRAGPSGSTTLEVPLARSLASAGGQGSGGASPAAPVAPDPGLRLIGLEVAIPTPSDVVAVGRADLVSVRTTGTDPGAGATWTDLAVAPAASGWTWTRVEDARATAYAPPTAAWGRLLLGAGPGPGGPAGTSSLPTRFELAPAASTPAPVPVLVNDAFLAATGAAIGDTLDGGMVGDGVRLRIVAVSDLFPPLDPTRPFMVVDRPWFELARWASGGTPVDPDEWWLTTDGASSVSTAALAGTLEADPFQARSVEARAAVSAALAGDPISLGSIGALALGAFAALVFSTLGYIVHAAISTREVVGELALLRALGTSGRQVLGWLWVAHASLLAFSLAAGAALGLLLAWLIVPTATVTAAGRAPVPSPAIVVPVEFVVGLVVAAVALLAIALAIVARQVGRLDLATTLRDGGG